MSSGSGGYKNLNLDLKRQEPAEDDGITRQKSGDAQVLSSAPRKGPPWIVLGALFALLAVFNTILIFVVKPDFHNPDPDDEHEVQPWEPYVVLNGVAVAMVLMALGLQADLLLFGLSSIFAVMGTIHHHELLGGLGNSGVVAVATLCIVSKAIDQTKALKGIMSACLGSPGSTWMGMLRMSFPVVAVGTVFNNTPLVAVMIPIVKDWTKTAGLQASHFMMPLSFVTMLSACITTMGSSTNLLAVQLVPEAEIAFLDLAPCGFFVMLVGVAYCALMAPILLPANSDLSQDDPKEQKSVSESVGPGPYLASEAGLQPSLQRYTVCFELGVEGPLLHRTPEATGILKALQPPAAVRCIQRCADRTLEAGDQLAAVNATAEEIAALHAIPGMVLIGLGSHYRTEDHLVRHESSVKDIAIRTSRFALPVRKWVAANLEGGWSREEWGLYEVIVPPGGVPQKGRSSVIGRINISELQRPLSAWDCTVVAIQGVHPSHEEEMFIGGGEIILVQALHSVAFADQSKEVFKKILRVPEQIPPVSVVLSPLDPLRPALSVLGLAACVGLSAFEVAPLVPTAILVSLGAVVLGTLSVRDLYGAINGPVLLTVAGSFGVGAAFAKTGVASLLAHSVLSCVEGSGPCAVLGAVTMLALSLGVIVSNNTTVILLAPMVKDICERQNMSLKMVMITVIYAANLSFATPFSYQTNMMVMPHGQYVFLDYVKFGVPMMLLCGVVALLVTFMYWS